MVLHRTFILLVNDENHVSSLTWLHRMIFNMHSAFTELLFTVVDKYSCFDYIEYIKIILIIIVTWNFNSKVTFMHLSIVCPRGGGGAKVGI